MRLQCVSICLVLYCLLVAEPSAAVPDDPSFEGVPLSSWLLRLSADGAVTRARDAVRSIEVKAIPLLRAYLEAKDSWIRVKAKSLIRESKVQDWLPPSALDRKRMARLGYDAFDLSIARGLVSQLDDTNLIYGDGDRVYEVTKDLERIGSEAIPALVEGLENDSAFVRYHSCFCLGHYISLRDRSAVEGLAARMNDSSQFVRIRAAIALGQIKQEPSVSVPALSEGLIDESLTVRYHSARALASFEANAQPALGCIHAALESLKNRPAERTQGGVLRDVSEAELRQVLRLAARKIRDGAE